MVENRVCVFGGSCYWIVPIMIRILQVPILAILIAICIIHAKRFFENKAIGPWFHLLWGCVYAVPCVFLAWRYHSWIMLGAFVIERFVFYNPTLNILRDEKFFYIVTDNSKPGFWDKIEVWWGGFYPYIWGVGVLGYIIIQFIQW